MVNIEAFKDKFKSTLKKVDKNIAPVKKELDKEFSKLNIQTEKKGTYQEQIAKEETTSVPSGHSRNK
jgi:hypothetical protein